MRKFFQALTLVGFVWAATGSVAKATVTYVVWNISGTFEGDLSPSLYGTMTYAKDDMGPGPNSFVDWTLNTTNATYSSDPAAPHTGTAIESGGFVQDSASSVYIVSTDGFASLFLNFSEDFDAVVTSHLDIVPDGTSYESVSTSGLTDATSFIIVEGGATTNVPEPASLALFETGLLLLGSRLRRSEG